MKASGNGIQQKEDVRVTVSGYIRGEVGEGEPASSRFLRGGGARPKLPSWGCFFSTKLPPAPGHPEEPATTFQGAFLQFQCRSLYSQKY